MSSSVYVKCHYEKEQRIFIILTKISNEDQEGLGNRIIVVLIMYEGTFSRSTLYA